MPLPTVLVVDDEPLNLAVMSRLLQPHYRVLGARSGQAALALLQGGERPELILLDVMMPELDGYAVLQKLRAEPAWAPIPVIFVTALHGDVDEEHGFELGAVDYIAKPIKPAVVLARVRTQIELKRARDRLVDQNAWLETELARRVRESLLAQDLVLAAMAQLAETRDSDTGNHIQRTQSYIQAIGRELQRRGAHAAELSDVQLRRIVRAAPMHDIGKIGIPDHILLKPARLTAEEFEVMKTHAALGGEVIARAIRSALSAQAGRGEAGAALPETLHDLEVARVIATYHHERWDGHGYPEGRQGAAIPLPARLMAVADVFDALAMKRSYKDAWAPEEAARYIVSQSGTHFDPTVVAAFEACRDECLAIAGRLAD